MIEKEKKNQIILPASCVNVTLQYINCEMGHTGRDKTLAMTRDRFYWPNMNADVDHLIKVKYKKTDALSLWHQQ